MSGAIASVLPGRTPPPPLSFFAMTLGTAVLMLLVVTGLYSILWLRIRPSPGVQAAPCPDRWFSGKDGKCYGAKSKNTGRLPPSQHVQSFRDSDLFWKKRWADDNNVLWAGLL